MTAQRDTIVFLAHVFDAEVERRFRKLRQECSRTCDVFLLTERGLTVPETLAPFTRFYEFARLRRMARSVIGDSIVPGNCHLRAIDYYRRFPGYRFYWFVEYDVVYTGDWGAFIASFAGDESDLLAAHVRTPRDDPDWSWRGSFSTGPERLAEERWVLAFLPVHRISARGLEAVTKKVRDGWSGHFEALVPTALACSGLRVSDIGGSGAWTPSDRVLRHYLDWQGRLDAGTLRWDPPVRLRPIRNMLYHPCKTGPAKGRLLSTGAVKTHLRTPRSFISYAGRVARLAVLSRLRQRTPSPAA